jgi:putative addiction module component (TIGR02574 family)
MDLADVLKLQALPVSEKLLMVEVLWQSMGDANNELEVSEEERWELDSRWARFERDPSRALTLEQFDALVKAQRG